MPAAYDEGLRRRVLGFLRIGGSKAEARRRFSVNYSTVYRWERQFLSKGGAIAKRQGRKIGVSKIDAKELMQFVEDHPNSTLAKIGEHFGVSSVMILKRLKQIGSDFKTRASIKRADAAEWRALRKQFYEL